MLGYGRGHLSRLGMVRKAISTEISIKIDKFVSQQEKPKCKIEYTTHVIHVGITALKCIRILPPGSHACATSLIQNDLDAQCDARINKISIVRHSSFYVTLFVRHSSFLYVTHHSIWTFGCAS